MGAIAPNWNIFDAASVPTNQPFPYVAVSIPTDQIGETETASQDATDSYPQVSIFTRSGGFAQARNIAAEIRLLTHKQPLDLSASSLSQFFILYQSKQEIFDGVAEHIPIRFKLITQG